VIGWHSPCRDLQSAGAVLVITMSTAKQFARLDGLSTVAMCLVGLALPPAHQAATYSNPGVAISESAGDLPGERRRSRARVKCQAIASGMPLALRCPVRTKEPR
jgi:hypothetical protein